MWYLEDTIFYSEDLSNCRAAGFFERNILKEVCILRYFQSNSKI